MIAPMSGYSNTLKIRGNAMLSSYDILAIMGLTSDDLFILTMISVGKFVFCSSE